jgi:hypothetical protein
MCIEDANQPCKRQLDSRSVLRFLSRLIDQLSVDQFTALSFKESDFQKTVHFLPREAFLAKRLGNGLDPQQECGRHRLSPGALILPNRVQTLLPHGGPESRQEKRLHANWWSSIANHL